MGHAAIACRLFVVTLVTAAGVACGPPDGALVTRCQDHPLEIGDAHTCEVTAVRLTDEQASTFNVSNGYSRMEVTLDLQLVTGAATVWLDTAKNRTWSLRAGTPVHANLIAPIDRGLNGVMLRVRPDGAAAEGLSGTLHYKGLPAE